MRIIDLRSDTVTLPTPEMYDAMAKAHLGDDVLGDDSDVRRLETIAAERLGKEAALFVPSGTMANLIAILCFTKHGDAIAMEAQSHTYMLETAGMSAIAGTMSVRIPGVRGVIRAEDFEQEFHAPFRSEIPITLLALENTHNLAGGTVLTPEQTAVLCEIAHANGAHVHMDGARLFNSAVAQGVTASDLTRDVDSVMFSLSKGLSCPVGSLLCADGDTIKHARHHRSRLGGGMRQSGLLAACGIVALERMIDRLHEDHANARLLAVRLQNIEDIEIDMDTMQTNLVYFRVTRPDLSAGDLVLRCEQQGVRFFNLGPDRIRLVTHKDVSCDDCEIAADVIAAQIDK